MICLRLPAVSIQLVKKLLTEMKRAGEIRLNGRGRGAFWELNSSGAQGTRK